jgi:antitoxin component of MazEF toxin-antitoxin module
MLIETPVFWESLMKVAKWGNALAIRLPIAVVRELGLKDGDQVDIRVSGERAFVVARVPRPIESPAAARVPPR